MRNGINIIFGTALVSILLLVPYGKGSLAASDAEKRDAYFVDQFGKIKSAFEKHIEQLERCIAQMELFERKDTELVFKDDECSRIDKMRPEAQELFRQVKTSLEEYYAWISSLTEKTFEELVEYSKDSQSRLLAMTQEYLDKYKEALTQSERIMQKQAQRLSELEKRSKEVENELDSSRESDDAQPSSQSN